MLFILGVFCSICSATVNLIVYFLSRNDGNVGSVIAIVICGVVVALIALPMLGFLIFHIYLAITGKTTR